MRLNDIINQPRNSVIAPGRSQWDSKTILATDGLDGEEDDAVGQHAGEFIIGGD
jgi:hypothetical protein